MHETIAVERMISENIFHLLKKMQPETHRYIAYIPVGLHVSHSIFLLFYIL